jgi:SOS response regulatory protein OraA/RecX
LIENLVARWTGKRAAGAEKIRAELQKRGAPDELIEESLGAVTSEASHVSMLDALRAKFKPGDDRARAARFLLSRGFAEDEIESPLDEFFGSE